jgi:hypothetical protein
MLFLSVTTMTDSSFTKQYQIYSNRQYYTYVLCCEIILSDYYTLDGILLIVGNWYLGESKLSLTISC